MLTATPAELIPHRPQWRCPRVHIVVRDVTTHRPIATYEAMREPKEAPHKLHIHLFESPVEILGTN
ncbi:hypothetical protein ACQQ7G_11430, partial [Corynebacterium diphtheriae]